MNKKATSRYSEPLWYNVYHMLNRSGNKISRNYVKETVTSNPAYPSLAAVTDFLDFGNMRYQALEADESYIHEFGYPLLAHIRYPGEEFVHLINSPAQWETDRSITQFWSGVVIFPEKDALWENEFNANYLKQERSDRLLRTTLLGMGVVILAASIARTLGFAYDFLAFLSFVGLIVSINALAAELGFQSELVKQVCGTFGSSSGCEGVLKSKYAKGVAGITPSFAAVVYFASQFAVLVIGALSGNPLVGLSFFGIVGVGVAAWSLYTQAVKLRKWCPLCLAIVAILILQSITILFPSVGGFEVFSASVFAVVCLAFLLLLIPIKKVLTKLTEDRIHLAELRAWKSDPELFAYFTAQEATIKDSVWENDVLLGNENAPIQLTVACNPYCRPCSEAHKMLDKILNKYQGRVRIQFRFLCNPQNVVDSRNEAVTAILRKASTLHSKGPLQELLNDWFEWSQYDKWKTKWQPDERIDVSNQLISHYQWIQENHIAFTPTIFFNGYKMPGRYSLTDFEVLIPSLTDASIPYQPIESQQ